MARKVVTQYLVKIVPSYLVSLLVWRALGLAVLYHSLVASALDVLHPILDPTGSVRGVFVEDKEFVFRLWAGGKGVQFRVMGDDLTSNMILLVSLFLASPIKSNVKPYVIHFASALAILFAMHVLAVAAAAQYALAMTPEILGQGGSGHLMTLLLAHFAHFYELIGMYFFVLVLWTPYVASYLIGTRNRTELAKRGKRNAAAT